MSIIPKRLIEIEITSDSICPFCYLGYRRIMKGIESVKHLPLEFDIKFVPFLLDPTLPQTPGENKRERYISRYGGAVKVAKMEQDMIARGVIEGINFSYGGNISQTTNSHRALEKARELKGQAGQLALVEEFFASYFEKEEDIGSHEVLSNGIVKAGIMTKEEALKFLASDELNEKVKEGILISQQRGISGVPFFIFSQKLAVSGCQEVSTFVEVLEKIASGELKI